MATRTHINSYFNTVSSITNVAWIAGTDGVLSVQTTAGKLGAAVIAKCAEICKKIS